ncbi:MAG: putative RND superfamily exporter protein [Pseudohongiellaceae bacterium]|jgi:predicted RND superfamily exporter protein
MEMLLISLSNGFAQIPNKVLRFRSVVLSGLLVLTIFMVYGVFTRTELDMTTDSFLDQSDPAIFALNEYRRQFGSDDSVFLVYRAKDGDVFSRASLTAVQKITQDLRNWQNLDPADYPSEINGIALDFNELNHIRRIQSIANVRYQENQGDTLLSNRLVPAVLPESDEALAKIKANALAQEDYLLAFYSADARYGAIMIQTDFGAQPVADYAPAVDAAEITLDDSFGDFSDFNSGVDGDASFNLEFDESAAIQQVTFEPVNMLGYTNFHIVSKALYDNYSDTFDFFPVGNPPMMEFMMQVLNQMMGLGIVMVLIFTLLLWILFRSFSAVLWPMVTIAASIIWTWGITVWLGVAVSQMISLTVLLVFAVGIADCVHVMSAYFSFRRSGVEHYEALSKSYGKTGLAIFVTTLTTTCGVLALTTSDLLPIQVFGLMSAFGVVMAFFFTIILLPILLDLWHPGAPQGGDLSFVDRMGTRWTNLYIGKKAAISLVYLVAVYGLLGVYVGTYIIAITAMTYVVVNWQNQILTFVPFIVAKRPWLILGIFATVFGFCAYGTSQVKIDTNMTELTREDSALNQAYDIVDENMAGAQSMVIMVDTKTTDGLLNPKLLKAIDDFQTLIEQRDSEQVTRTNSLANIVKDTNEIMNDDNPAFYTVPESEQMISQLLYLFNSANPEDRRSLVSDDYSRSHITLNIYNAGSYQYKLFFDQITKDIDTFFGPLEEEFPELDVYLTGSMALMMRMADEVAQSQFDSFTLAIGVISLIMILTLGSIQGGLMAMIPNMIPALLGFGLMGLMGIPLDTDTLLIAPLIIGIAVDDTIHFMTHYRMELIRTGSVSESLRTTILDVGQAVMFTTMVLGLGFALLSFSDYLGMAKMGFFGAAAIFVALLCDLFLIPAMIIIFKPTFGVKNADTRITFMEESV